MGCRESNERMRENTHRITAMGEPRPIHEHMRDGIKTGTEMYKRFYKRG